MNRSDKVKTLLDAIEIIQFTQSEDCNKCSFTCEKCAWYVHGKNYCELNAAHNALCNIVYDNVPHGKNVEEK